MFDRLSSQIALVTLLLFAAVGLAAPPNDNDKPTFDLPTGPDGTIYPDKVDPAEMKRMIEAIRGLTPPDSAKLLDQVLTPTPLENALLSMFYGTPKVTPADPRNLTPALLLPANVTPAQVQTAMTAIALRRPELFALAKVGATARENLRVTFEASVAKELADRKVALGTVDYLTSSYEQFLRSLASQKPTPIQEREIQRRAMADTREKFRSENPDMNDPAVRQFYGRALKTRENDEEFSRALPKEREFEYWKEAVLKVVAADRSELEKQLAALRKELKLGPSDPLPNLYALQRDAKANATRYNLRVAAAHRVAEQLAAMQRAVDAIEARKPRESFQVLGDRLRRNRRDFAEEGATTKNIFVTPQKKQFGDLFEDLIWSRTENEWFVRTMAASLNPRTKGIAHAAAGTTFRPRFWKRFAPLIASITIGLVGTRDLYNHGYLDKPIAAVGSAMDTTAHGIRWTWNQAGDGLSWSWGQVSSLWKPSPAKPNGDAKESHGAKPAAPEETKVDPRFADAPPEVLKDVGEPDQPPKVAKDSAPAGTADKPSAPNPGEGSPGAEKPTVADATNVQKDLDKQKTRTEPKTTRGATDPGRFGNDPNYDPNSGGSEASTFKVTATAGNFPSDPQLVLADVRDLAPEKLRPLTLLGLANSDFRQESVRALSPEADGKTFVMPLLRDTRLNSLAVFDKGKKRLQAGVDFDLFETEFGIPVLKFRNAPPADGIHFAGSLIKDSAPREVYFEPDAFTSARKYLREAGMLPLANALDKMVAGAKADKRLIPSSHIADMFRSESLYSWYSPPSLEPTVGKDNPFAEITPYLDGQGRLCGQCNIAREGVVRTVLTLALPEQGLDIVRRTVLPAKPPPAAAQERLFGTTTHAVGFLHNLGDRVGIQLDGTPDAKDPRAPGPPNRNSAPASAPPPVVADLPTPKAGEEPTKWLQEQRRQREEKQTKDPHWWDMLPYGQPGGRRYVLERKPAPVATGPFQPEPGFIPPPMFRSEGSLGTHGTAEAPPVVAAAVPAVEGPAPAVEKPEPPPAPARVWGSSVRSIEVLDEALRKYAEAMANHPELEDVTLPHARALRVANALRRYAAGRAPEDKDGAEKDFRELAEALHAVKPTAMPDADQITERDLPKLLTQAAAELRSEMKKYLDRANAGAIPRPIPAYENQGFAAEVGKLLDAAAGEDWTPGPQYLDAHRQKTLETRMPCPLALAKFFEVEAKEALRAKR